MKMIMQKYALLITGILIFANNCFARVGSEAGNGGDMCEDRIESIRSDIKKWIQAGGSAGLSLPSGVSLKNYNEAMLNAIGKATISCTDDKIELGNSEKTCRNFVNSAGVPQIQCNLPRFTDNSESDQYVLVHHEYAGLAGFEVNSGEESHYEISNQIADYLEDQTVKKLSVKRVQATSIDDHPGETAFSNGKKITSLDDFKPGSTWTCQFDEADNQFSLQFVKGSQGQILLHSSMQPDGKVTLVPIGYPATIEQALPGRLFAPPVYLGKTRIGDAWQKNILVVNTVVLRTSIAQPQGVAILVLKVDYTEQVYIGTSSVDSIDTVGDNHWWNADMHRTAYAPCFLADTKK